MRPSTTFHTAVEKSAAVLYALVDSIKPCGRGTDLRIFEDWRLRPEVAETKKAINPCGLWLSEYTPEDSNL